MCAQAHMCVSPLGSVFLENSDIPCVFVLLAQIMRVYYRKLEITNKSKEKSYSNFITQNNPY
jgi:hypothetical protein